MGDNEIDQTTVDVIKTILESKNGKEWFIEYLRHNLRINALNHVGYVTIDLSFNGCVISTLSITSSFHANSF